MTVFNKGEANGRRFARPGEAARYLKIGRSTLYQWVRSQPGFPKLRHLGARIALFDLDELDAYLLGGAA
jgi:excisionase family DNA binding protein